VQPVELLVLVVELATLGLFDRDGEDESSAFVAQVGQGVQVLAGPLVLDTTSLGMLFMTSAIGLLLARPGRSEDLVGAPAENHRAHGGHVRPKCALHLSFGIR
jgi:hypothetical protein